MGRELFSRDLLGRELARVPAVVNAAERRYWAAIRSRTRTAAAASSMSSGATILSARSLNTAHLLGIRIRRRVLSEHGRSRVRYGQSESQQRDHLPHRYCRLRRGQREAGCAVAHPADPARPDSIGLQFTADEVQLSPVAQWVIILSCTAPLRRTER